MKRNLVMLHAVLVYHSWVPAQTINNTPPSATQKGNPVPVQAQPSPLPTARTAATLITNAPFPLSLIGLGNASSYVPDDTYKLRIGDRVNLQILEDRDLPRSLVVADSGELDFPYVGRLTATGKTCKQLAAELKARLEQEYYYRASVVLALEAANRFFGRVYVWGQVKNQGPLDLALNENLTAGKAILRAGGFGEFANRKKVKVVRSGGTEGNQVFELNMVDILQSGKLDQDLLLQPDDLIMVPTRLLGF